ncbi:MAG: galactose-1-phosphate uridylyltransferase [Bacillota bacterium]|nr:galactose-1-phosphate uridylyltransferase [Bacillota bacterium]
MAELRYNPLLDDWTMVSADRSKRPDMPKDFCPFCPGSGKVPETYDVLKYDNDFPILSQNPPQPDNIGSDFYKTQESYGKCEVILYSPDHEGKFYDLSQDHIEKLVRLWIERFEELKKDQKIKYILPFENKGKEVGTTMIHPHGQIYAYPIMPLRLRLELKNSKAYFEKTGTNIYDQIIKDEKDFEKRIVFENDSFIVLLPFFANYPFETYIIAKDKISSFSDFNDKLVTDFARTLKELTGAFDQVYNKAFPYMMAIYQEPVNSPEYEGAKDFYRFNVKFFPPLRGENSIKYNASSETAAWVHGNPRRVEETAEELRRAYRSFINEG